ncbi:MAG: hypothetical protein HC883_03435 [Bdellovibrionaceae bacterium]|nr:hypothetical protein [Pseudobdellovibrionaceae bacterium]
MSKNKNACHISPKVAAEDIIDSWVIEGGLNINQIKVEREVSAHLKEIDYSFVASDGFSIKARIYFANEDGGLRRYVQIECAIAQVPPGTSDVLEHLLSRNREIPASLKLGLSDSLIILCFRGPEDGYSTPYLKSLVEGFIPCAVHLHSEMHEKFGIPTLMESISRDRCLRAH